MRKLIAFLIFVAFAFGVYSYTGREPALPTFYHLDEFDSLDREFWYVGEWNTYFSAYDKVKVDKGKIKLEIETVDKGPILLSKPIEMKNGNILTVKRRVKISYGNNHFTGGMAILETMDKGVIPSALNNETTTLGNGVVLVEYVHSFDSESERPGNHIFRILPRTWAINDNYELAEPIFDQWFEEELIYNTVDSTVTYKIDGKVYSVKSQEMSKERIRVYMHGYGYHTGHVVEIDWIEISID